MNKYIVDSVTNGSIAYYVIRNSRNHSIVPLPTKYLKYKKNLGRKDRTLKSTALKLSWYLNYLSENNLSETDVLDLSFADQQEHFSSYLHYVKAGRHTASGKCPDNNTANEYLRSVFDYYEFLILEFDNGATLKVLQDSSFTYTSMVGLRFTKSCQSFQGYLPRTQHSASSVTEEDLNVLISASRSLRDKLLLLLLEETGFRIGEILGIRYTTDIDFENRKLRVRYRDNNPNRASAKYAEERSARISDPTFDLLNIYLAETADLHQNTDYLFISEFGSTKGQPLTARAVASLFERLEKQCGIHVHAHMFRHYFANERRKAGWDLTKISTALGHRSIAATESYLNVADDELTVANNAYFNQALQFVDINDFL